MRKTARFCLWTALLCGPMALYAADFNVISPGFYYEINGNNAQNPTLTLTRGVTYTFDINTDPSHPVLITDGNLDRYDNGVQNNDIFNGTLTFTVPLDAPDTLFYICSIHTFGGQINVIDPPLPPAPNVKVVSVSLTSSSVTIKSIGTNGWVAVPEFSSNLVSGTWAAVPNFTNTLSNGTNTTVFNRLEPICGPNVFLRVRNQSN
jgi:hypothetical protein